MAAQEQEVQTAPSQLGRLDALLVYVEAVANPLIFERNPQIGLYYLAQHAQDSGFRVRIDTLSANDSVVSRLSRILGGVDPG